ncbi:MAG: hypothetical protein Kow0022_09430 [Phycisphaerales bacterium]
MGMYRAGVLVAVHVAIIAHIIWWLVTGKTISPIEPSESMQTLEQGIINAGFVFFALALLSTLLLGRYVCGWGCHIIAVQDLCRWIMLRFGIRPKPFRSRLLMLVPLGLALYMFVWPSFKRGILFPALDQAGIERPAWLKPVAEFNGFETEFIVEDFWATFAPWYMVAPFIFVVGFASVYFLGSKGFCTYGCPYGGLFTLADKLSPFRVRVTDACQGCGQCTAACSSNVRVHEEVRDFGKVIDAGCMKTMDCIAVCPNQALYIGFGTPALGARPRENAKDTAARSRRRRLIDTDWIEEIIVSGAFLAFLLCYRQMMGMVPLLMAVGMAIVGAFCVWALVRMIRQPSVRVQQWQLKLKGRVQPAGWVFSLVCLVAIIAAGWSGLVRYHRWQADMLHSRIDVPASVALLPEFAVTATDRRRAERALSHFARADSPAHGGIGWALNADELVREAYLCVVIGDLPRAESALLNVIDTGRPTDSLIFELGQVMQARGADQQAIEAMMQHALDRHAHLHGVRRELAVRAATAGGLAAGERFWDSAPEHLQEDVWFWVERARFRAAAGSVPRAIDAMMAARHALLPHETRHAAAALELAEIAGAIGELQLMGAFADFAGEQEIRDPATQLRLAAINLQLGRTDAGASWLSRAEASRRASIAVLVTAAQFHARMGQPLACDELLRRAAARAKTNPWELLQVANATVAQGMELNDPGMIERGLALLNQAIERKPESAQLHAQKAVVLANLQRLEEAADEMARAAELGADNALLADRASQLYAHAGNEAESARWREQAVRRSRADPSGTP